MRSFTAMRSLGPALVTGLLLGLACAPGCKSEVQDSALMLGFSSDMEVPDDVGAVGVYITADGREALNVVRTVERGADGTYVVRLPSTLAVRSPATGVSTVRARIVAFDREGAPFVMRQATATTPKQRVALLRMPLLWVNRATLSGAASAPSTTTGRTRLLAVAANTNLAALTDCNGDPSKHRERGECVPVPFYDGDDANQLPEYDSLDFFGLPHQDGSTPCFDVSACFAADAETVAVDAATCAFDVEASASALNVGVESTDPQGVCGPAGCIVALSQGTEGVRVTPSSLGASHVRVDLPAAACRGDVKRVVVSRTCAPLTQAQIVCNKSSAANSVPVAPKPAADGGMSMDSSTEIDGAPSKDGSAEPDAARDGGPNPDGGPVVDGGDGGPSIDGGDAGIAPQRVTPPEAHVGSIALRGQFLYGAAFNFNGQGAKIFKVEKALIDGAMAGFTVIRTDPADTGLRTAFSLSVGTAGGGKDFIAWSDPMPDVISADKNVRGISANGAMWDSHRVDVFETERVIGVAVQGYDMGPPADGVVFVRLHPTLGTTSLWSWSPFGGMPTQVVAFSVVPTVGEITAIASDPRRGGYPVIGTDQGEIVTYQAPTGTMRPLDQVMGKTISAITIDPVDGSIYYVASQGATSTVHYVSWDGLSKATLDTGDFDCGYTLATANTTQPCGIAINATHAYVATVAGKIIGLRRGQVPPALIPVTYVSGRTGIRGLAADATHVYWSETAPNVGMMPPPSGGVFRLPALLP